MTLSRALRTAWLTALAAGASLADAQPTLDWGGLAYVDYTYQLADPDPDRVGTNTFDYRRLYLTADAALTEPFRARVRLEATGRSTLDSGRPAPFVKDAWVRWRYAAPGHSVTLGVQPPPLFEVAESVWGYRSLDKTLIDRTIRDSRDFGLRADGPLAGPVRYATMIANGNGVQPEDDGARGKRVYGQLVYTSGPVRATLGAGYTAEQDAPVDGVEAVRETSARVSGFVGAVGARARGGAELFYVADDTDAPAVEGQDGVGVSLFGALEVLPKTSLVARYDFTDDDIALSGADEHYLLGAVAYRPIPAVAILPNVIARFPDGAGADVQGRVTVEVRF